MITRPPYDYDRSIYPHIPEADKWAANKLMLAERLGYNCGPIGIDPPNGRYCLRPQNSIRGLGHGGWFDVTVDYSQNQVMPIVPGYFWCEWFDGDHIFTTFINDVAVHASRNPVTNDIMRTTGNTRFGNTGEAVTLPAALQGLSRYLQVESIEDKIIEVSFRCMSVNARQEIIDDYLTIDSSYNPSDIFHGNSDVRREAYSLALEAGGSIDGWTWGDPNLNRRPWDT